MNKLEQFRKKYPQYKNVSDERLLKKIHEKYYPDMAYEKFLSDVTLNIVQKSLLDGLKKIESAVEKIDGRGSEANKQLAAANKKTVAAIEALTKKITESGTDDNLSEIVKSLPDVIKKSNSLNMLFVKDILNDMSTIMKAAIEEISQVATRESNVVVNLPEKPKVWAFEVQDSAGKVVNRIFARSK